MQPEDLFRLDGLLDTYDQPGRFAEVGCDHSNDEVKKLVESHEWLYVGFDLEGTEGAQGWDIVKEPLPACFDFIACMNTLEHVEEPIKACQHMADSLSPGGRLFIAAPFAWDYHCFPVDYWRFTPDVFRDFIFPSVGLATQFASFYPATKGGQWTGHKTTVYALGVKE